jgi:hypothetical protein
VRIANRPEANPEHFIKELISVFREVRRALRDDGTLWLNIGDSYAGGGKGGNPGHSEHIKPRTNRVSISVGNRKQSAPGLKSKDLIGMPWMLAFALRSDGGYLRQEIIWNKPIRCQSASRIEVQNPMNTSFYCRKTSQSEYTCAPLAEASFW